MDNNHNIVNGKCAICMGVKKYGKNRVRFESDQQISSLAGLQIYYLV